MATFIGLEKGHSINHHQIMFHEVLPDLIHIPIFPSLTDAQTTDIAHAHRFLSK